MSSSSLFSLLALITLLTSSTSTSSAAAPTPSLVILGINTNIPAYTNLSSTYVSTNIDAASLAAGMDFSDPLLTNMLRQMGDVELRVGGTSAHGLIWTGEPGMPCGCCGPSARGAVYLSTECFDSLGAFLVNSNTSLLFDFSAEREDIGNMSSPWNSTTARNLFAYVADKPYAQHLVAWEIGNEDSDTITTGEQLGRDLLTLQKLALSYNLSTRIVGPSLPKMAYTETWLEGFMNATHGKLDRFAYHLYGGVDCKDVSGWSFISRETYQGWGKDVDKWVNCESGYDRNEGFLAESTGIFVEETASTPIGGCINASDRFIDGFFWMTIIGLPGEHGGNQINRQDLAGWSFLGRVSHYELVGIPGWVNATQDGPALPHPDWFTTVLWKQIMGNSILNVTSITGGGASNVTIHTFCTSTTAGMPRGSISLGIVNAALTSIEIQIPSMASLVPRTEFILTATANMFAATGTNQSDTSLPKELWDDAIYLNGILMTVDKDGNLPSFPIKGNHVTVATTTLNFPPLSYGFVILEGAQSAACM